MKHSVYGLSVLGLMLMITGNVQASNCAPKPTSSLVVNVKDKGAKGDGVTNDTSAIQAAVNQVANTGGLVYIPPGTYQIDGARAINLGSNMAFRIDPAAILRVIPNNLEVYSAIKVDGKTNVKIVGGAVRGERSVHKGTTGEWGMGINITRSSAVYLQDVAVQNFWGDGVYVGDGSSNVNLCGVFADNNRRQGMSIVSVNGMKVDGSTFQNTNGAAPQAGIDIEPNTGQVVENVTITNSRFLGNRNPGFMIYTGAGPVRNITFNNNLVQNNNYDYGIYNDGGTNVKIQNNTVREGYGGILLKANTSGNTVTGNDIVAPASRALTNQAGNKNTVSNNYLH